MFFTDRQVFLFNGIVANEHDMNAFGQVGGDKGKTDVFGGVTAGRGGHAARRKLLHVVVRESDKTYLHLPSSAPAQFATSFVI